METVKEKHADRGEKSRHLNVHNIEIGYGQDQQAPGKFRNIGQISEGQAEMRSTILNERHNGYPIINESEIEYQLKILE